MSTERAAAIIVIPTEMSRSDGLEDIMALLGGSLLALWLILYRGAPILILAPILVGLALYVLSGEPACEIKFVGGFAATMRSAFGQRRIHQWALAWLHYFRVKTWPDWRRWFWHTRVGQHITRGRVAVSSRVPRFRWRGAAA